MRSYVFCALTVITLLFLQACGDKQNKTDLLTKNEINHLATAQYYEIQNTYVEKCKEHGVDYSDLFGRFEDKYKHFFGDSKKASKRIIESIGMTYKRFREETIEATIKAANKEFCEATAGDALRNRIENPKVVERGIQANFVSLKKSFEGMGLYKD